MRRVDVVSHLGLRVFEPRVELGRVVVRLQGALG